MSQKIIGLDIGAYSVKALVLDPRKQGVVLQLLEHKIERPAPAASSPDVPAAGAEDAPWQTLAGDVGKASAAEVEAPLRPAWAQAAGALLAPVREEGDLIAASLPDQQAATLHIPVPFGERGKVAKILPGLLMDRMPLPMEEVVYDFTLHADGTGGHTAVIGFARRADVAAFVRELAAQGLDPAAVSVPELVLEQVARALLPADGQSCALLDLGHSATRLIVWHQGRAALVRTIHVGGQHLTAHVAEVFKASEEDAERVKHAHAAILLPGEDQDPSRAALSSALVEGLKPLVRDLRRSLQALYAKERVEVRHIYITGGTSRITHIERHLSEALGVEVQRLSEAALEAPGGPRVPPELRARLVQHGAMALGQAQVIQTVAARANHVNLRQGALSYRGSSSFMRAYLMRMAAAAAVLMVLLLAALGMQYKDRAAQRDAMRAAVKTESKKLFGQEVYTKKDVLKRVEGSSATRTSVAPKTSAYQLLFELASKVDPGMKLEVSRMEFDVTRSLVQIYGSTSDPQAVDKLVSDLEGVKCLKDIKKDKLQVKSEDEASFELQINSGGCS